MAFEGGMPIAGALAGRGVGIAAGGWARWAAVAVLAVVGAVMLLRREDDELSAGRLLTAGGATLLLLGLSVSLDELAIGFTLGLLGLPLWLACLAIAVQAGAATQLGLWLGRLVGERLRERAERAAGLALIGLAVVIAVIG